MSAVQHLKTVEIPTERELDGIHTEVLDALDGIGRILAALVDGTALEHAVAEFNRTPTYADIGVLFMFALNMKKLGSLIEQSADEILEKLDNLDGLRAEADHG